MSVPVTDLQTATNKLRASCWRHGGGWGSFGSQPTDCLVSRVGVAVTNTLTSPWFAATQVYFSQVLLHTSAAGLGLSHSRGHRGTPTLGFSSCSDRTMAKPLSSCQSFPSTGRSACPSHGMDQGDTYKASPSTQQPPEEGLDERR